MSGSASVTLPGVVEMILKSEVPNEPETAQIAFKGVENSVITIDNTLTDKSAHEVRLNAGAKVEVTIKAETDSIRTVDARPDTP